MMRPVIIVLKEQVFEDARTLVRIVSQIRDMDGLLFARLLTEEVEPCPICGRIESKCKKCN